MMKPDKLSAVLQIRGGRDYPRELVRQRDNRTCQLCKRVWVVGQRRFDVHHLYECGDKSKAYDRIEDMGSLITFCHRCHLNLHSVKRKMRDKDGHFKLSKERNQHPFYRHKQ